MQHYNKKWRLLIIPTINHVTSYNKILFCQFEAFPNIQMSGYKSSHGHEIEHRATRSMPKPLGNPL